MSIVPALALFWALLTGSWIHSALHPLSGSGEAGVAATSSTRAPGQFAIGVAPKWMAHGCKGDACVARFTPLRRAASPRSGSRPRSVATTPEAAVPCHPPATATPTPTPDPDDSSLLGPTPTPAPDLDAAVDPLLESMTATAAANLQACWNAADWDSVTAILTPRFLETAFGISTPVMTEQTRALSALELGPLHVERIGPVGIWSDGRGAVDVLYFRGRGNPVQAVTARWFLIAERGVVRFDEEVLLLTPPLGDRVTVGFAIADDNQPMQWSDPTGGQITRSPVIALHGANRGWQPHTFLLEGAGGETLGILTLPPWRQGDLALLDLPAGTYRLRDPAVGESELELRVTG
jgi:hypothetical protein